MVGLCVEKKKKRQKKNHQHHDITLDQQNHGITQETFDKTEKRK